MALPVAARNSVARQTFPMVRTLAIAISLLMLAVAAPSAADPGIVYFGEAHRVAVLTGPKSINATHTRYGVHGTDLGITWQGAGNRFLMAFGDTFGRAGSDWRSNTLAVSSDRVLADGMRFDGMITDRPRHAKELLPSRKIDNVEKTVVPTGGAHAGRDYLSYMSVRRWGTPGADPDQRLRVLDGSRDRLAEGRSASGGAHPARPGRGDSRAVQRIPARVDDHVPGRAAPDADHAAGSGTRPACC